MGNPQFGLVSGGSGGVKQGEELQGLVVAITDCGQGVLQATIECESAADSNGVRTGGEDLHQVFTRIKLNTRGNITTAAQILKTTVRKFAYKAKRFGVHYRHYR